MRRPHTKYLAFLLLAWLTFAMQAKAQTVAPEALYTTVDGEEISDASTTQNAPLKAHFKANPQDLGDYAVRYEWKIYPTDAPDELLVHRFEEEIDYTFDRSGSFAVQLYATFVQDGDTITWPEEGEEDPFIVSISESKLEMPNAFSPNGDDYNEIYNAKSGYQSIVSFKATVFNRWGQKIYSWDNPDRRVAGWDGTWHGRKVKDGVYYVVVAAKGADGRKFNIRKDVNVLTTYDNGASNMGGDGDE